MRECPQQMNGSDCGVFSCMFAEHTTKNTVAVVMNKFFPHRDQVIVLDMELEAAVVLL